LSDKIDPAVRRKLGFFGHIMRKLGDCLKKEMVEGTLMRKMDKRETSNNMAE